MNTVIAIDGPAASGKSTVARLLAKELRFLYVDTGAMYRTFAWLSMEEGVDPSSRSGVKSLIQRTLFETPDIDGHAALRVNGIDPAPHIRSESVNAVVSVIASIPELREFLVNAQRALRDTHCLVMEGRDIGTVVFTDTPHKYFIDADPEVRAQRRKQEGQNDATGERDRLDRSRASAPLIKAADARLIDSTHQDPRVIVDSILGELRTSGLSTTSL
ncbi:MAG: (d)CMP kinase [Candidatus Methylacidiphilales bacterium]